MAGTVEATATAEKTDMYMVCNTHSEGRAHDVKIMPEEHCCFVVRKTCEMEIMIMMRVVSKEKLCSHRQKINK